MSCATVMLAHALRVAAEIATAMPGKTPPKIWPTAFETNRRWTVTSTRVGRMWVRSKWLRGPKRRIVFVPRYHELSAFWYDGVRLELLDPADLQRSFERAEEKFNAQGA